MNRVVKKGIVLLIIIALITLVGCGDKKTSDVEFEKGTMKDLTYTNNWLDFKVSFPDGYIAATDEQIAEIIKKSTEATFGSEVSSEASNTLKLEYGFMVVDPNQVPNYQLSFENLRLIENGTKLTEKEYLEKAMEPVFSNEALKYELLDEGTKEIAGKEYAYYEMSAYDGQLYQRMYSHKKDNKMVVMTITYAPGQEYTIEEFLDSIEKIK